MTLRYPESPTQDERDALSAYFHLSSRLYPCGECAAEFQELLRKYPPQVRYVLPLSHFQLIEISVCEVDFVEAERSALVRLPPSLPLPSLL